MLTKIAYNSSIIIYLKQLEDPTTGDYVDSAEVNYTITDDNDDIVDEGLLFAAGSDGYYYVVVFPSPPLTLNAYYTVTGIATAGGAQHQFTENIVIVNDDGFNCFSW